MRTQVNAVDVGVRVGSAEILGALTASCVSLLSSGRFELEPDDCADKLRDAILNIPPKVALAVVVPNFKITILLKVCVVMCNGLTLRFIRERVLSWTLLKPYGDLAMISKCQEDFCAEILFHF